MYRIIGGDQREYGPISAEQMRRWIAEGRLNSQSLVQPEGTSEWRRLAEFPEFAAVLGLAPLSLGLGAAPPVAGLAPDLFSRDYELDIGRCIGQAWELLQNNFGAVFAGSFVFLLIQIALGGFAQIPLIGVVGGIASFILSGPLYGGLYCFFLRHIRHEPVDLGTVFAGFRIQFGQLLLGYVVAVILISLAALPGVAVMAYPGYWIFVHHTATASQVLWIAAGFILLLIPVAYLIVSWVFALPLIVDQRLDFWPAMEASRKLVGKHFWTNLGLLVVCGLIKVLGICVCCVGGFISWPISVGALMYAYERIFIAPSAKAA
jgi:hypothetical protein